MKDLLTTENRTKYFAWILFFLSIASIVLFSILIKTDNRTFENKKSKQETANEFSNINIEGKSAIVWDIIKGQSLFEKNPDASLPLASLTKVMTALTASKTIGNSSKITINEEYLTPDGDSGLRAGDRWTKKDLLDYTLITSSNDGAYALASVAQATDYMQKGYAGSANGDTFVQQMNSIARDIGLENSRFWNAHGLDRNIDRGGAYGSARDMATLFEYIMKTNPNLLEVTRYKNISLSSEELRYDATNTNQHVDQIPGLIASKTGYTDLAGGNLVVVFDAGLGRPIIVSVLGSTQEGRFEDTLKLVEATLKTIQNY